MFRTPRRGDDLRHLETCLTDEEIREALLECRRLRAIDALGDRWLGAPNYNGHYRPELMPKAVS